MKKAYPKYKDTDLPWPNQVPTTWDVSKISAVFEERKETVSDKDFTPLSVTKQGIVPQLDSAAKTDNGDNRKKVVKGDFVINSRSDRKGSAGLSYFTGSVSVINTVLKPLKNKIDGQFSDYLLKNYFFQEEFYRYGKGIVDDLWSTKFSNMKVMPIPLPSLPEQQKIAAYLDHKCNLIDTFIEKKSRLIKLLKEQKQAIINKAVTKGIDPDVPMKPSGIEWLGDIPEHWEVKKLKQVVENLNNRRIPLETTVRGRMENRKYDYYGATGIIDKVEDFIFNETTILLAEDGANLWHRNIKLVYIAKGKYWVNNHAHILKPNSEIILEFIAHSLECYDYRPLLTGSAQPKLTKDALMNISLVIPPKPEQERLTRIINKELNVINKTIDRVEKEIFLIKEYKTTLIAEAVTGKIDVRDWQAKEDAEKTQTVSAG